MSMILKICLSAINFEQTIHIACYTSAKVNCLVIVNKCSEMD